MSGNAAKDHKKQRINARHVFLAVSIDEELKKVFWFPWKYFFFVKKFVYSLQLLNGVTIPQGGVLPHINAFLFKGKSGGDAPSQSVSKTSTKPTPKKTASASSGSSGSSA